MNYQNEEPSIAPEPNRWYNITLGPSLLSDGHSYHSPKFCALRYEFKPASIDKAKPGSLHKRNDYRVTLEFQNNQIGKPKVRFDGISEDYNGKDKDAILFFDGETFRLEKLHRAIKRLKYLRVPEDSAVPFITEATTKVVPSVPNTVKPAKVVQIDINNPVSLDHENEEDHNRLVCESEEDVNIDDDDNDGQESARKESTPKKEYRTGGLGFDINLPHPAEMEDDEIADVDINDDELDKGLSAAEALRAQVNAEAREQENSKSLSSSSGRQSESSESGAESSGSGSSISSSKSRNSGSESGTASH